MDPFPIRLDVYLHQAPAGEPGLAATLKTLGDKMATLIEQVAEIAQIQADTRAEAKDAAARVLTDVGNLNAKVTDLETQVANLEATVAAGGASPEVVAALATLKQSATELKAIVAGIDPNKSDVLPPG